MAWNGASFLPGKVLSCLSLMPGTLPDNLQPSEELRARQRMAEQKGGRNERDEVPEPLNFSSPEPSDLSRCISLSGLPLQSSTDWMA